MTPEDLIRRDKFIRQVQASQDLAFEEAPQMFVPPRYVAPDSGIVGYVDASDDKDNFLFNRDVVIPELMKEFTPEEYKNRAIDNILNSPENQIVTDPRDERRIINPKRKA